MSGCLKETDTEHKKAIDRIVKRYKSVSDESKEYQRGLETYHNAMIEDHSGKIK